MEDKIRHRFYFLLRLFRVDSPKVLYVRQYRHTREWWTTEKRSEAHEFQNRSEARQRTRAVHIAQRMRDGWLWEVVRVDETITTSFKESFVAG